MFLDISRFLGRKVCICAAKSQMFSCEDGLCAPASRMSEARKAGADPMGRKAETVKKDRPTAKFGLIDPTVARVDADRRSGERQSLVLSAQCRTGAEHLLDVWLTDLSHGGCQLFACAGLLDCGQDIAIVWHGGQVHKGHIVWSSGMKAGIEFDLAIPGHVFEKLLTTRPAALQITPSDYDQVMDRFGRALAPLPSLEKPRRRG